MECMEKEAMMASWNYGKNPGGQKEAKPGRSRQQSKFERMGDIIGKKKQKVKC